MAYREILNSPSTDLPNLELHMDHFPLKISENYAKYLFIQRRKKSHRDGKKRQRYSLTKTPLPSATMHNRVGSHHPSASPGRVRD